MENRLKRIVSAQKEGRQIGIYSACSANPLVLEAVLQRGKRDNAPVLIESTANQCDQFGGYTGKTPQDFKNDVYELAAEIGFDTEKLFLGGDHLGPLTFAKYEEEKAMRLAEDLIDAYVSAGFTKIHIDTSMKVASDPENERLSDEVIAQRAVRLAKVAEAAYTRLKEKDPNAIHPVYIAGSEVPIPGGSTDDNDQLHITRPEEFAQSVKVFEEAFKAAGMEEAWSYVIGFVVQPGVEEKDSGCVEYDRTTATELMAEIKKYPNLVYEGHSTDYQTKYKLRELVEDGVGILKVGPALTYAMREGLFALSYIEDELVPEEKRSHFRETLDEVMLEDPKYFIKHYHGTPEEIARKRKFSFSDRCRYYFADERIKKSMDILYENLKDGAPYDLLSQFMPVQYKKVREGQLINDPKQLVLDRIDNTLDDYLYASRQEHLYDE